MHLAAGQLLVSFDQGQPDWSAVSQVPSQSAEGAVKNCGNRETLINTALANP
jgi:hypothetical protein